MVKVYKILYTSGNRDSDTFIHKHVSPIWCITVDFPENMSSLKDELSLFTLLMKKMADEQLAVGDSSPCGVIDEHTL